MVPLLCERVLPTYPTQLLLFLGFESRSSSNSLLVIDLPTASVLYDIQLPLPAGPFGWR